MEQLGVNFINILGTRAFFVRIRIEQLFSSYVLAKKAFLYEKGARTMLMKLTAGGNTIKDPKNTKIVLNLLIVRCFKLY